MTRVILGRRKAGVGVLKIESGLLEQLISSLATPIVHHRVGSRMLVLVFEVPQDEFFVSARVVAQVRIAALVDRAHRPVLRQQVL